MSKVFPDRNLPKDIAPTVNGLRYEAYLCLRNGNYKRAEKLYLKEIELIKNKENQLKESIHKGTTYYNLGISKLFQKERKEALKYIFQAFLMVVGGRFNTCFTFVLIDSFQLQIVAVSARFHTLFDYSKRMRGRREPFKIEEVLSL